MTKYTHLSLEERKLISRLHGQGLSMSEIAYIVRRDKSSVSRELKRNRGKESYNPETAERKYLMRRKKECSIEKHPALKAYILERLQEGHSPQLISGRLREYGSSIEALPYVSPETIYQWLYRPESKRGKLHKYLPRAHRVRGFKKRPHKSQIKDRTSVHKRPEHINERSEVGHWEADLIAFQKNSRHILVCYERKLRYTAAIKLPSKRAEDTIKALISFFRSLPAHLRKSVTFDNGLEFARHMDLQSKLSMKTFFCDPYASWQKGGVENMNGRLRRDLPRNTHLNALSEAELEQIIINHNLTPRACLNYKNPFEALADSLGSPIIFSFNHGVALHP